jgi:hypothetical protein
MKTTKNFTQIAKVTFASVSFLFASLMPMQAATGKNSNSEINEIQTASSSLAMFNNEIQKAVEFNAPSVSENFEVATAESNLNELFGSVESEVVYSSPSVNESFEVTSAMENLDTLTSQLEASVRFTASVN